MPLLTMSLNQRRTLSDNSYLILQTENTSSFFLLPYCVHFNYPLYQSYINPGFHSFSHKMKETHLIDTKRVSSLLCQKRQVIRWTNLIYPSMMLTMIRVVRPFTAVW